MTERKNILNLMNELAQNPAARRAYRQNPQTFLARHELEHGANAGNAPLIPLIDGFHGVVVTTHHGAFIGTIRGIVPRYN